MRRTILLVMLVILNIAALASLTGSRGVPHFAFGCSDVSCWEQQFAETTRAHGAHEALDIFEQLRLSDGLFRANCHVVAHSIGEAAYARFEREGRLEFHAGMNTCAFGFFHGFMQEYISHGGSSEDAHAICGTMPQASHAQCAHGIGHGIVYAGVPWVGLKEESLVATGITQCEKLLDDPYECINGVFGGISLLYFGVHGLFIEPPKDDPFWICREVAYVYQKRCYDQMVPVLLSLTGDNFEATGKLLSVIDDEEIAKASIGHLAFMPVHTVPLRSRDDAIALGKTVFDECRAIGKYFDVCAGAFAKSIVFSQLAPEGASWAKAVCETYLKDEELASCLANVDEQMHFSYEKQE